MKIVTVVGARPQFIKAAVVSRQIRQCGLHREVIVHTGQHFDSNMSDVFFEQMQIPRPDYHLGVSGGDHGAMTAHMLLGLENVLKKERPDWVLVYGDTNSTLAGALASVKLHIPVAHVEAGLRSYNMRMAEEVNRVLTDRISTLLLCPTLQAVRNLEREGFSSDRRVTIRNVGDVMYDAALFYRDRATPTDYLPSTIANGFALATVHRAENTDNRDRLASILAGLDLVHEELPVVLPIHPRTRQRMRASGLTTRVHLVEPVGYLQMVWLLKKCRLVLTDSGGLQKEAWYFRRPCVTMRDETEWTELIEAGGNRLAGAHAEAILEAALEALAARPNYDQNLYGTGRAGEEILQCLTGS